MNIGFIGLGKLGLPCASVINNYYTVIGYDVQPVECNFPLAHSLREIANNCETIFIAVPTPHSEDYDGSVPIKELPSKDFDYSIVKTVLEELNLYVNDSHLVILISTVLPGTIRNQLISKINNARFIYNPYLIAMGSVEWDMVNPECLIIGTKDGSLTGDAKYLIDFYQPLMQNNPPINVGTWDEAEAIKIFYNTFISTKLSFVNMIQDVAEKNGNINVDVVTNAFKNAPHRILGPKYLTAGMGDAGACHPRDNIALRYLANKLELGYDFFSNIMESRDQQAKNIAIRLVELSTEYKLPIVIHGKSYKPYVPYINGSYSLLVGHFIEEHGYSVNYADPLTHDVWEGPAVILLAHNPAVTYFGTSVEIVESQFYFNISPGSVIVDPWRAVFDIPDCVIIHYGNTRKNALIV